MPDPILFTVVIPTYNRAHLIVNTIASVRRQLYKNYEILVVDNKSTDNTAEVLSAMVSNGEITYIQNEKNFERSYSRNVGFRHAKGDYITLLDSDDILYPECLQDAAAYIAEHPGTRFFHGLYEMVDDNYQPLKQQTFPAIGNPLQSIMEGNFISNIAVFYRKELIEKVQFDENPILTGVEDYDFVIRVLEETRSLGRIEKVSAGILQHPQRSVNLEEWDKTNARIKYFINKHLHSPSFQECYGKYKSIFLSHINLYLCAFLAVRGRSLKATGYWLKAVAKRPATLFTRKCWIHFFVIIKYIFR
jgi:glycosyltransferase involved in cell wall biosynthesis